MNEIKLTAPDISCEHCERAITEVVGEITGVDSVSVDILAKIVTINFDEAQTNRPTIEAAMDEEGYPVTK